MYMRYTRSAVAMLKYAGERERERVSRENCDGDGDGDGDERTR